MVMIAAANPRLWQKLCHAVGAGALADDPRFKTNTDRVQHRAELKSELERAFAPYTVAELAEILEKASVPCGQVRTVSEALADPQIEARQMFFGFDDPELAGFEVLGTPIKLSDGGANPARRPPKLGEDIQPRKQKSTKQKHLTPRNTDTNGRTPFVIVPQTNRRTRRIRRTVRLLSYDQCGRPARPAVTRR
jgi:crotonobetainyl-CoA:carnitine CoA-transferase CaiB-like acyl-CoA transferase